MDFQELSYQKQEKLIHTFKKGNINEHISDSWFVEDTIGNKDVEKRHKIVDPLLESYPGTHWLTVGDGRYGTDAGYLKKKGFKAMATDISEALLVEGFEKGIIDAYKAENAEMLSFEDKSFDFVLCKESLHHFPQPMKALYEMLRIARKGVVMLEPPDQYIYSGIFQIVFRKVLLLFKLVKKNTYEVAGNYVYKISEREIEKVALALNYPFFAIKKVNLFYTNGVSTTPYSKFSFLKLYVGTMNRIFDTLTFLKLMEPTMISVIIFKTEPENHCLKNLRKNNYKIHKLQKNPYLS
jgi:ubiquinone/menaquinone biosynthesis C-methylase UbiE